MNDDNDDLTGWAMDSDAFDDATPNEQARVIAAGRAAAPEPEPDEPELLGTRYRSDEYRAGVGIVESKLDGLAKKYEEGEIDFGEYRKGERELLEQRGQLRDAEHLATHSEGAREAAWQSALQDFMSGDGRFLQAGGGAFSQAFGQALQARAQAGGYRQNKTGYAKLLKDAATDFKRGVRELVGEGAGGGSGRAGGAGGSGDGWAARW